MTTIHFVFNDAYGEYATYTREGATVPRVRDRIMYENRDHQVVTVRWDATDDTATVYGDVR